MTLTLESAPRSIQVIGLLGALVGVGAILVAPFCGSSFWAIAGGLAVGLDVVALRTHYPWSALGFSLLKLAIVVAPITVLLSCAAVVLPPPPIPTDLGPNLLMLSAMPSVAGAILLRFAR